MIEMTQKGFNTWAVVSNKLIGPYLHSALGLDFRINGVEYRERTPEFHKAFEQEVIWLKLQNK